MGINLPDKARAIFKNYGVRIWKWGLQKYFHFDQWHIVSLRQRAYARDIISYCNQREHRQAFLEIGCGLGDIIRNVKYSNRVGYDADERVLRAASFISRFSFGNKIKYHAFTFPASEISGKYDVILLVNWIHHIDPSVLRSKIKEYFVGSLNAGGVIIIDTVDHHEYKYNHDVVYLSEDLNARIHKLGDYERGRKLWLIIKKD